MTGSSRNGTHTAFQERHASLEYAVGRVAHASVDVSVLAPGKLGRTVGSILKVVRACLVERNCA